MVSNNNSTDSIDDSQNTDSTYWYSEKSQPQKAD